ncbi:hypothetical protein Ahy_B01g052678 [Arachis hypogaea]|uniref:FAR1 domain-containing protein n=1 Tax=Arachis hypogaea TaxID=3818 RepID=A0A445AQ13_ARAHY|nr:hypothetical protein Ahy_B01g052678 [Arachis hypogaea]
MQGVSGLEFARVIQHVEKMEHSAEGGKRAEKYISSSSRKREHRALTRIGCEAMLAVYFDTKTLTWRVKKLVEKHNHDLVPQCLVHLIANHRGLTEPQKALANTMHDHSLPTSKIMGLMVGQAGGYANVGFTKKDLDNHFQRTRRAKLIEYWENMIKKKCGLEENESILNEFEKRKSWASAYLRDKFCAGFRTTSRCEAINNFIKRFICIRQSLLELVQNLEHTLRDYRNNELVSQFKTLFGEPVLTTGLEALELSAANFYTREILGEVKKEIQGMAH